MYGTSLLTPQLDHWLVDSDQRFSQVCPYIDCPALSGLAAGDRGAVDCEAVAPPPQHFDIPVDIEKFVEMGGVVLAVAEREAIASPCERYRGNQLSGIVSNFDDAECNLAIGRFVLQELGVAPSEALRSTDVDEFAPGLV